MRRFLSFGFVFLLGVGFVSASVFQDIDESPYREAILELYERGIVEGYANGTYRPDIPINRAEFLKILMDTKFGVQNPEDVRCFKDLEVEAPEWYASTVCLAKELGVVHGYPDGNFRARNEVNLVEALKMTMRTFGIVHTEPIGPRWYEPYIAEARSRGLLLNLSSPAHFLTRGEMASLTYAFLAESEPEEVSPVRTQACGNGTREGTEQCDDGNTRESDGCSSICILVPEPVRIAILQIDQQTTGSLSTVARGQEDTTLLKFTAVSGRQDALLTELTFQASVGSLQYAKNYELAMDRDGSGTYETVVGIGKVDLSTLSFGGFANGGVLLPEGLIVPFVLRADLVNTSGPVALGIGFKTTDPNYVEAQGVVDGLGLEGIETNNVCAAPNCFIRVNTVGSANINVEERGTLYVTQDTTPVRSHILLGGTISDALLRLRLRAEGEKIDVVSIRIDGGTSSIESLLLYKLSPGQTFVSGSSEPFAQATNGQCPVVTATRFCATMPFSTLVVPQSGEVSVVIAARMKTDAQGGISGESVTLSLASAINANFAVQARGISSSETLAQNDGDGAAEGEVIIGQAVPCPNVPITGKTHDTALATISAIQNASTAEESFVPTGAYPIASFKFFSSPHSNSAEGLNDVLLRTIRFKVSAQNVQIDPLSYKLSSAEDPVISAPCTASATIGSIEVICSGLQNTTIQNCIPQGQSLTLRLTGTITNSQLQSGPSTLRTSLLTLGQRGITNSVEWSDRVTTFTWVDTMETSVDGTLWRR